MKIKLSILFCTLFALWIQFPLKAEVDISEEKESYWSKWGKEKKSNKLRSASDSTKIYPHPFLTLHLGVAHTTNFGNVRLNSEQAQGTKISLRNDLDFPKTTISPRVNIIFNYGNFYNLAFDMYSANRRETEVISKDIKYGNAAFPAGSEVKTTLRLTYASLCYSKFFFDNGRGRIAALAGVAGIFYHLNIKSTTIADLSQKKSIFVPLPAIGLNGSVYLTKNLFLRGLIKYSAWWSKNYNCNVIEFIPYFEYFIFKNIGVGMRYNFGYTSFENLPDKKFNGSIENSFNAISGILVYRFLKKGTKGINKL
ncbi:hypothetical protein MYP_2822 [Sporocytophaga myxococcoides]|uniref:Outer membrane protein beta-barrel domain-containing protein n=1 Tax=Sporocytophaga myxococcoides TaxID=153721 RepID=A0A098LHF8_9BACT|nr:hypothetical protein [Sporocytophaga myxococcoides]GAL85593.1 hypothetical protein MYP_2822 [Sporocytophaga myxococcoides]